MGVVIIFLFLSAALYLYAEMSYLSKDILRTFAVLIAISSIFSYGFIMLVFKLIFKNGDTPTFLYLCFIPIFLIGLILMKKKRKINSLEIVANQQRYWNEIKASDVYKFFEKRKQRKSETIAIRVNEEEKKLLRSNLDKNNKYLSINFFKKLKRIEDEFTFICTKKDYIKVTNILESLKDYELYTAIFNKINQFVKKMEIDVDYGKILKENQYCAEFFLMDLWERYTKRENIGNANLILLANREIEEELVGALDNIDLNCVKAKGAALYYRYMVFTGRAENYIHKRQEPIEQFNDDEFL